MPATEYSRSRFVAGVCFAAAGIGYFGQSQAIWTVNLAFLWPLALIAFGTAVLLGRAARIEVDEHRSGQLTVAEERVRIARELHDIVAHSVTLMTVQVAAARRVSKTRPEDADTALAAAEQTGRDSLIELRRLLEILRSADASIEAASPRSRPLQARPATLPSPIRCRDWSTSTGSSRDSVTRDSTWSSR